MASTFMSMSNGMNISNDIGKSMATTLTGLAGDMASYYNVSADVAQTALESVFTGETESLKKFGIILTEANIQQYAYSQGINKSVNQMSQAEKVMLRYNYILSTTAKVQGDFARTSGNWANQIRILKEQFSQLLGILGRGLIAVLKPVVVVLNEMLSNLISIANAIAKAFGGSGLEKVSGSVSSSIGEVADGTENIVGGFDEATASAKKLNKTIAGFDELNVLNSSTGKGGIGAGIGVGSGNGIITEGIGSVIEGKEEDNTFSKLTESAKNFASVLKEVLAPAVQGFYKNGIKPFVDWVKEKFEQIKKFFTNLFNDWAEWFKKNKEQIKKFGENLGIIAGKLLEIIMSIGDGAWAIFSGVLTIISEAVQTIADWLIRLDDTKLAALIYSIGSLTILFKLLKYSAKVFGYDFIYVLTHLRHIAASWIAYFKDYVFLNFINYLSDFAFNVKKVLLALVSSVKNLITSLLSWLMAHPISVVIIALVALIAVKGDEIQEILGDLNNWLKSIFTRDWTETFGPVLGGILNSFFNTVEKVWDGIYQLLNGVIDFIRGVFTLDWKRAWEGVKNVFAGVFNTLVNVAKAPINMIIGLVNKLIQGICYGVNSIIRNINKLNWKVPEWVPAIGGETFGFALKQMSPYKIPLLANGGVINNPTVAMMGEYAGVGNNPEIVSPQALLQSIIENSNNNIVEALIQQTRQLLSALENINMSVSIGDDVIAQSAMRGNNAHRKRTGEPLFV